MAATTFGTELARLELHKRIITEKLTVPSNSATRQSLYHHIDRLDWQIRKLCAPTLRELRRDPWEAEQNLKKRRSRDRQRLREARTFGDDDYAETVKARIERAGERIEELREEQTAEITGEKPPRFHKPTAEDARRGIEVVIKYARVAIERARVRGDTATVEKEDAHIGRLERMIEALPGVPT